MVPPVRAKSKAGKDAARRNSRAIQAVEDDPGAFGGARIWNDYGDEDPFRVYNEGFVDALEASGTNVSAHSWPGGHEGSYWTKHWPAYQRFYANSLAHCG